MNHGLTACFKRALTFVLIGSMVAACGGGAGGGAGAGGASGGSKTAAVAGPVSAGLLAQQDGWSFPNFPASTYPNINFDAEDLVSMFGADTTVCVDGVAQPCVLTAEAAAWARMVNQARSTGHCEGLVALAAARFNGREQIKTVKIPDQDETIHTVMRTFATQFVPEVQQVIQKWTKASLADKVDELKASFADGKVNYTLGVYVEGGGHALLPYAVEYPSPDVARIMVYDSNWPAKNRFIDVDLVNESWKFSFAGADPSNDPDAWTGGAGDMDLTPFDSRQGTCPFCGSDVKVAGTTLLLRTADLDWSVSTPDGVVTPAANSTNGAVVAKPVKGGARDSYDYLIQIPPSKDSSTTTTAAAAGATRLTFGGSASVFAIMPTGIASFTTPGGSGKPVEVGNGSVSSKDPAVSMSLASGNLVAAASGASAELAATGETMAVTVTAENGQVITQEVTPETPTVQVKADASSGGLTVLAQASTGEVAKTEVSADGTQTKSVVPAGTLNLTEDLNKVEVVLPKELESKPLAVLPSLEDRNLANPNYKADTAYVAPTTVPAKVEEAAGATTLQVKNAALPTTTERGDSPSTVATRNAALPTTTVAKSVTAANADAAPAAVARPTLLNFRVAAKTFGDDAFTLDPPDSNSSGGFRYTSSNSSVASVSSTTGRVTITGAGSTVITATQAAAKGFEAATIATTLTVGKAKAVLSALKDIAKVFGDDPLTIKEPTSTSPAAITWTSSNESVAKFSKTTGRLVITGAGRTTITATQAATDDYLAGSETFVLTVGKAVPVLSALTDVVKTFGDGEFTIAKPTSDSRGLITFTSSDDKVATIDSATGVVKVVGAGSTTVTVSQAATDDHSATSKTLKLTIGKSKAVWGEFKDLDKTFGDAGFKVALPSSTSDGKRTFASSDDKVATIDATTGDVMILGAGTATFTITQAASPNFEASSVSAKLTIGKAAPDITGVSLLDLLFGAKVDQIVPKSTSTGAFTFSSSNTSVLSIDSSGNVKVVGVGTATITVKQASTTNYEAGSASVTVKVGKGAPALERLGPINKEFGDANFSITPTGSPSTGAYSYESSNTSVATVNAATGVVTITGVGVATLTATQAATDTYDSASTVVTLTVARGIATLGDFTIPTKSYGDATFVATAPTSTSTGAFTYTSSNSAVATINSTTGQVTIVGVGTSVITARQAQTLRHVAASITATLTVNRAIPVFGAFSIPTKYLGDAAFTLTAPTSTSTGAFTYTSSNTGVATVDSSTGLVTMVGVGTSTINATQAMMSNHIGGAVSASFEVLAPRVAPVIGQLSLAARRMGDSAFDVTAPTSTSAGTFVYSSSNPAVATVSASGTVTPISVGSTTITATQSQTSTFSSATSSATFRVVESNRARRVKKIVQGDNFAMLLSDSGEIWKFHWTGFNRWSQFAGKTYSDISLGSQVCAVTTAAALECGNFYGAGMAVVPGFESDTQQVSAGWQATCAIKTGGNLYCWGSNGQGQVGDGTTTTRTTPVFVMSGVKSVVAGGYHSCAIMLDSTLKCWGANWSGQVGDGTTTQRNSPVTVAGLSGVTSVAIVFESTCAVASGVVKCWGGNYYGELGTSTGNATYSVSPLIPDGLGSGQQSVSAGGRTVCTLSLAGAVRCWGFNLYGAVGDGTFVNRPSPVPIPELQSDVIEIQLGNNSNCALLKDLLPTCWGYNYSGQLANGSQRDNWSSPAWTRQN